MNDELPPGSQNLEDDSPEPIAQSPEPAPVAAAPPDPAAPTEQEVQQADGDPAKAGILAALRAERDQKQALQRRVAELEPVAAEHTRMKPTLDFVLANPQLLQPRAPEAPPVPASADPDAVEAAQLMDFYKPDGSLDVEKGAKHLALMDRRTQRQTAAAVQPYRDMSLQERSTQNFARALTVKDANGQTPTPEALKSVWSVLSVEDTANPEIAATLAMLALGADRMRPQTVRPAPVAPAAPPLYTEASGGNSAARPQMSRLEENIAQARGVTPQKWAEHTKGFVPGRPTVMDTD